jgi:hypothetical protein
MKRTTKRRCGALVAAAGALALLTGPGGAWALDIASPPAVTTASAPPAEATVQGTNPHGQGTVLAVSVAGKEAVVVGRSRGEQKSDGTYHGHNTTLGLLGQDVIANDTTSGQTAKGPLAPIQEGVLDPVCKGSSGNVCLDVLRADSATTTTGSTNHQKVAGVDLGGKSGASVVAADSTGSIHSSGTTVKNSGAPLVAVGGTPIPLAGCGANTPGELINIAPLLAIACNADSNAAVGAITNTGLVGTVLDNAGTPTAMITGADTGASAQPPAQAVLGVRQASPAKAGAPHKPATSTGAKGTKKAHVPAAAKKARPLKASKASGLPYTGTDLVVVLFLAACLLSIGTALRARTRLRG